MTSDFIITLTPSIENKSTVYFTFQGEAGHTYNVYVGSQECIHVTEKISLHKRIKNWIDKILSLSNYNH